MSQREATLDVAPVETPGKGRRGAGVGSAHGGAVLKDRSQLTPEERQALEELAYRYGTAADSYFVVEPDGQCLLLPDLKGAVAVFRNNCYKHLHAPGGLLAAEEDKPRLVAALKSLVGREHRTINCYSILESDLPLFEEAGFQITKFGEEPVVDLGSLTWSGKGYEWIRRQANYCRRHGVVCHEIRPDELPDEEWSRLKDELFEVLDDDLRGRPFPCQLALLEGRLYPDHLERRRLFVARKRDDARIEAFLVANPMREGREWAFELYRKRKDATRGVMPHLMKDVIDLMQDEGVEQVDLCVVPGKGTEKKSHPNESWLVRRGMDMWYRRFHLFMNFQGQHHFKSRFRPRMVNRYVCVAPKASLFSIVSFFRTVGAFSVSYRNLLTTMWRSRKGTRDAGD